MGAQMGDCQHLAATNVEITREVLRIELRDGRVIVTRLANIPWLRWLREASDEPRSHWSLEPGGSAVYWEDLDDGVEVRHLLALSLLPRRRLASNYPRNASTTSPNSASRSSIGKCPAPSIEASFAPGMRRANSSA